MRKLSPFVAALTLVAAPLAALSQNAWSYWAIQNAPAAGTQATIAQPAVTVGRHVARSVTVCVSTVALQGPLAFNLRDGASGAGPVLWTVKVSAPLGFSSCQSATLNIAGTAGTAMTLESASAPAAGNFATVSLNGYTTY